MPLDKTDWNILLNKLELPPEARQKLWGALSAAPYEYGVRGMLVSILRLGVKENAPEQLADFDAYKGLFLFKGFFGHIPMRHFGLLLVKTSLCIWPDRDPWEGSNDFMNIYCSKIQELPLFKPLVISCEGDPGVFFEIYPAAHSLVYSTGEACFRPTGKNSGVLDFYGVPSAVASYYGIGYCKGVLEAFGYRSEVKLEARDQLNFSISMVWN